MPKQKLPSLSEALSETLDKRPKRASVAGLGLPDDEADPPQPAPTPTIPHQPPPIAPARDFNRRANSIERDALPAGMFPGSSKKLYDALYLRTRGANPPRTSVKATKRDLMDWSGIRNVKTVEVHVRYLVGVGLLAKRGENGDREGFAYEVRFPTHPNQPPPSPTDPDHDRKTVMVGEQKTVMVGVGQAVDFQRATDEPKTKVKTNTLNDDDVMPLLRARVGKPMPKTEAVLLELLATLEARTDVSSPDALLAHVLRRKLQQRSNTAQRRPVEEQFRGGQSRIEVTAEDLEEYERIRAELDSKGK